MHKTTTKLTVHKSNEVHLCCHTYLNKAFRFQLGTSCHSTFYPPFHTYFPHFLFHILHSSFSEHSYRNYRSYILTALSSFRGVPLKTPANYDTFNCVTALALTMACSPVVTTRMQVAYKLNIALWHSTFLCQAATDQSTTERSGRWQCYKFPKDFTTCHRLSVLWSLCRCARF